MIDSYEQQLFEHFIGFKDYSKFNQAVVDELSKYGIPAPNRSACDISEELAEEQHSLSFINEGPKGSRAFHSTAVPRKIVKQHELFALSNVINSVGIINFPELFAKNKTALEKFIFSQPFNLLTTKIKYDLTVPEVAARFNIRTDIAYKQLTKARRALGAKTYAGAFAAAIKRGIIDLNCNYIWR